MYLSILWDGSGKYLNMKLHYLKIDTGEIGDITFIANNILILMHNII